MKRTSMERRWKGGFMALLVALMSVDPAGGLLSLQANVNESEAVRSWGPAGAEHITDKATLLAGDSELNTGDLAGTTAKYEQEFLMGVAADFSVFVQNNFEVTESDTEGRVAVGGNFIVSTSWGSYSVGAGDYETQVSLDELLQNSRQGAATIILGGNLTGGPLNDMYYENGDKFEGNEQKKTNKKLVINQDSVDRNIYSQIPESSTGSYQRIDRTQTYNASLIDFNNYFNSYLADVSNDLAEKQSDGSVSYDEATKTIKFTYEGTDTTRDYVYFTLSEADYENFQNANYVEYVKIPKLPEPRRVVDNDGTVASWDEAYIVINIEGSGSEDGYHLADMGIDNGDKKTKINGKSIWDDAKPKNNRIGVTSLLYNFHDATRVIIGNNFQGAIFAPKADVTDECTLGNGGHGHLSGALIAQSFKGATEFGYRPFAGPSIPADTYDVEVNKVDQTGALLAGATISIYGIEDGKEVNLGEDYTKVSAGNAALLFEDLAPGRYVLREDTAPEGYTKSEKDIYFEIAEGASVSVGDIVVGSKKVLKTYTSEETKADPASFVPAEAGTSYTWGTDIQQIAFQNTTAAVTVKVTFQYKDGSSKVVCQRTIDTPNSDWTQIVDIWGNAPQIDMETDMKDIVAVSIEVKFAEQKDPANLQFFIQGPGGNLCGPQTVEVTDQLVTVVFTLPGTEPQSYYKLLDESDPNGKWVTADWLEGGKAYVEAATVPVKVRYSGKKAVLTVYDDAAFTKGTQYVSDPLAIENNIYVINGEKYVFRNVKGASDYKIFKYGSNEEVTISGIKLYPGNGGYVVLNDGRIVRPTMILTKAYVDKSFKIVNQKVTSTNTPVPTVTNTPAPTNTPVPTVTSTPAPTSTPVPTVTSTPTPTNTPVPTVTSTPAPTNTPVPTVTNTPAPTNTPVPTVTSTPAPTNTPVPTVTSTPAPTNTPVPTATNTPTPTNAPVPTATNTPAPTNTPVPTVTSTPAPTNTPVPTVTNTPVPTVTNTPTPTNTPVPTVTSTPTPTNTPVPTVTNTPTPTNAPTATPTPGALGELELEVKKDGEPVKDEDFVLKDAEGNVQGEFTTDENGKITIPKLEEGDYTLEHKHRPGSVLGDDVIGVGFTVESGEKAKGVVSVVTDENGKTSMVLGDLVYENNSTEVPILGISDMPRIYGILIMGIGAMMIAVAFWMTCRRKNE